jgi:hypothetical protein
VLDLGKVNGNQRFSVIRLLAREAQPLHQRAGTFRGTAQTLA